MDAQSESCEPPSCDSQPPGKIRKALKLFSKRKPGSGVTSLFSMRGKCDGGLKSPPSRSKTLDGLTETVVPEAEAESVDLDQEDSQREDAAFQYSVRRESNLESTSIRQSISSITSAKSLSFLTMLRRSRKGGGGERQAQTESLRPGQQRKGLKGLFGNVRWNRKDKESADEVAPGPPLFASRSNSVEIMKESLTLTPRPERRCVDESETEQHLPPSQDDPAPSSETTKVSESAKPPTTDRLSTLLRDISSILSLDTITGGGDIVADVEAEWVKVSSRVEEGADQAEVVKMDKPLSAVKSTLSPTPISSTKLSPTPTTKPFFPSPSSPKPMPSTTTKPQLFPHSSPSPTISAKDTQSDISTPTHSPTTKPVPSSVPSPPSSPVLSARPIPIPITIPKSLPTSPNLTISTEPTINPISPPTPEPSPKPSPTPSPGPTHAAISDIVISPVDKSPPELHIVSVVITEPTPYSTATSKHTRASVPTPITKPSHSTLQDIKHSSGLSTKYPPFITSTKPTPAAPVARPKIVTTFGLSTSRNTAPISKPEPKQSATQTKSSPPQSQTNQNGSVNVTTKAPPAEPGPPTASKLPSAAIPSPYISQQTPTTSSATSAKPTSKTEHAHTITPSPVQLFPAPREEKEQEIVACRRRVEESQIAEVHARPHLPTPSYKPEKKTPAVKPTTLSKIPVSGGGRPKQPSRDAQPNGDNRHSNPASPVYEEESLIPLSRESSSKDALSDTSTESGAVTPVLSHSNEDILDSAAGPTLGAMSLPRESKIPVKLGSTATYHSLQGKTELTRSKIPVSKVPIRRTSNKPASTLSAAATRK